MNILWVVNIPFGKLCTLLGQNVNETSGSWLSAALEPFNGDEDYRIVVVTTAKVNEIKILEDNNITYCALPGGFPSEYNHNSTKNRQYWEQATEKFKPDVIQIWGTEFTHGYLALKVMDSIPSVIYMQGILETIARYYISGISDEELRNNITLRDIIKLDGIKRSQKNFLKRSYIEAEMIQISKNVIVENSWAANHCKNIEPLCKTYKCELNVKAVFFERKWLFDKITPFTIMSNAAGYPIKGLHILIKAFNIVVRTFPNAQLLIPGENSPFEKNWKEKLKEKGYSKLIVFLIEKYNLKNNIVFLGRLNAEEMAKQMEKSHVFVVPSSIENHSSTLIEAMIVGIPCIASYVGGIPEYLTHNENGLLYRFEEYEILADHIIRLFEDKELALRISSEGSARMRTSRNSSSIKEKLVEIYADLNSAFSHN